MTFRGQSARLHTIFSLLLALTVIFGVSSDAVAGDPQVIVRVGDTTALPGQQNSVISLYLDNFNHIIDGFDLTLHVGNPDILEFQVDTIQELFTRYWVCNTGTWPACTDSSEVDSTDVYDFTSSELIDVVIGSVDTTGTLISGWEFLRVQSTSGLGNTMRITANADQAALPVTPGFNPQQGGLLVKLLADVFPMDDTTTMRTSAIDIQRAFSNQLIFSTNLGNTVIGIHHNEVIDTNFYVCTEWLFDSCVDFERTILNNWDWFLVDTILVPYLDTTEVIPINGALTVEMYQGCCVGIRGNANNDPADAINISDVTFLVNYLFGIPSGPEPPCPEEGNANGDPSEAINISDVTFLVNYLFGIPSGPSPGACPGS